MSWSKFYTLRGLIYKCLYTTWYRLYFKLHSGCSIERPFSITGHVIFTLHTGSQFEMRANSRINSGCIINTFGGERKSIITVYNEGQLTIGTNSGISSGTIICTQRIDIGSNVLIGGGTCIYDTDFHGVNYFSRRDSKPRSQPIEIKEGAFIGGYCQILKGVTIGMGSVVAAGSVVTKDIPDFEIWGGNPARFIKKVDQPDFEQ